MAKLMEIQCPCCEAKLKVDIVTESVITYEEKEGAFLEDFEQAVKNLKGEAAKREDAFQKASRPPRTRATSSTRSSMNS